MKVIEAVNVNQAWFAACEYANSLPAPTNSRAGKVRVSPTPVTTVYTNPRQRVLLDPIRDCNPWLHLFESIWLLDGRDDARWLDQFVQDYSIRFAEPDGHQHGAYGKRWRNWFAAPPTGDYGSFLEHRTLDQLNIVIRLLRDNPDDRQAVISMWDPTADLGVPNLKDRPCNTHIYLRVKGGFRDIPPANGFVENGRYSTNMLDMIVCCRSNDIVWGAYGANAVHMSILQEYLAAHIGVEVGTYTQMSFNWHRYEETANKCDLASAAYNATRRYPGIKSLVDDPASFDAELASLMPNLVPGGIKLGDAQGMRNTFLSETVVPMFLANEARREGRVAEALAHASRVAAPDWRTAATEWLMRRIEAKAQREASA